LPNSSACDRPLDTARREHLLEISSCRLAVKKDVRDPKKGETKGAQRICTYFTYFSGGIPVNGQQDVRWTSLNLSVGLLELSVGLSFCPLGSFYAPFFFSRIWNKSSSFFTAHLRLNPIFAVTGGLSLREGIFNTGRG
jgi:hypothetical protein